MLVEIDRRFQKVLLRLIPLQKLIAVEKPLPDTEN